MVKPPITPANFKMDVAAMKDMARDKVTVGVIHHVGVLGADTTAEATNRFHAETKKWAGMGYHFLVRFGGEIQDGRPLNKQGVHVANQNENKVAVCFCGDLAKEPLREAQFASGLALVRWLNSFFPNLREWTTHKKLAATSCPGEFPLDRLLKELKEVEVVGTPIIGPPQTTVVQMQTWARDRGAHQRFVDVAPAYHRYGLQTGIRPEVLYAQAAKETAFGRYGGAVLPGMNNWAGIKTATAAGDRASDHQAFATPDDGVRAHYNHIAAYVGLNPVGEPHPRYHVVKKLSWAGTIKTVEELGARWAPNARYGESIVGGYMTGLLAISVAPSLATDEIAELRKQLAHCHAARADMAAVLRELGEAVARGNLILSRFK